MASEDADHLSAYKLLLGDAAAPESPDDALKLKGQYFNALRSAVSPSPVLAREVGIWPQTEASTSLPRPRHVSVSTGMRLCYLEWGQGGEEVVLLLHDAGSTSRSWSSVARGLATSGFRVLAPDLRGHGGSTWSSDRRYSAAVLAEDVQAFVTALDLYTRPLAVVGVGVGAAVALTFALQTPRLVGALSLIEFALPQRRSSSRETTTSEPSTSHKSLPWWVGYPGQGAVYGSIAELAAVLAHPLSSMGPLGAIQLATWMAQLRQAAQVREESRQPDNNLTTKDESSSINSTASRQVDAARSGIQSYLGSMRRPASAAASAWAAIPSNLLPSKGGGGGSYTFQQPIGGIPSAESQVSLAADPAWFFSFDPEWLWRRLPGLSAHLQLIVGAKSGWVSEDQCNSMVEAVCDCLPAPPTIAVLKDMSHWVLPDAATAVTKELVQFLEGPAIAALQRPHEAGSRRPELLGLRPLPEYKTLDEARKALGPRAIPKSEDVAAELRRLTLENGEDPQSDDAEYYQTSLANNPSDYFGMVG